MDRGGPSEGQGVRQSRAYGGHGGERTLSMGGASFSSLWGVGGAMRCCSGSRWGQSRALHYLQRLRLVSDLARDCYCFN